jgi:glycine cleavage system H protein
MEFPSDLLYTKHDEWVRVEGDEVVTGITDYAQDQLSDVVYVELPEVGDTFDKGEPYGVVESVKAASDVFVPVAGEIIAINEELEDSPEIVNEDPYGKGWFVRIKVADKSALNDLLDAAAYEAQLED